MKSTHDAEMRDVYANVYQDSYELKPEAMAVAMDRVAKNLEEFSISKADLARMNVLNVGPGREALALHKMGARRIFHFDISDLAVGAIHRAQSGSPVLANIQSMRRDLCAPENLPIDEGIDLLYLSGVLHHLHDPSQAMANIFPHLNPGARLFFRIYRSGSMYFFCCDFLRHFIRYEDRDAVDAVFHRRYPDFTPENKVLHDGVWDDFFVPVLNLFDPVAVDQFFKVRGFSVAVPTLYAPYDHQNHSNDGQGVSLYYTRNVKPIGTVDFGSFPPHVDQLSQINYGEDYVCRTIKLMQQFITKSPKLRAETRAEVAVEVHRLGQLRRLKEPVSAAEQHGRIQALLELHI